MKICESERLIIREFVPSDAELLYEYSQEQCTKDELPDEVCSDADEAYELIESFIERYPDNICPLVYAVELKETSTLIGHVSLSYIWDDNIEIGYAVSEKYQRRGFGFEATEIFTKWAKNVMGIGELYAIVKKSNEASWRIVEKCGYTLVNEESRPLFGGIHEIRIYKK